MSTDRSNPGILSDLPGNVANIICLDLQMHTIAGSVGRGGIFLNAPNITSLGYSFWWIPGVLSPPSFSPKSTKMGQTIDRPRWRFTQDGTAVVIGSPICNGFGYRMQWVLSSGLQTRQGIIGYRRASWPAGEYIAITPLFRWIDFLRRAFVCGSGS